MDKDIVVVIGVGGMGRAIARRIGNGRKILLADVSEGALSVADVLLGEGQDVVTQVVDVSSRDSVAALADTAAGLGRVTQIAHTAGLSPTQASTEAILRVDLLGVALVLDEFARVVAPGGAGVVIASMAGHMGGLTPEEERIVAVTPTDELLALPFFEPDVLGSPGAAYSRSKRANIVRVQAAAGPWGDRGARVNSISPGVISTPMGQEELAGESGEQMRMMVSMSAAKRLGTPDDIAAAAAFLLGQDASFVSGTDLLVDGGTVAAIRPLLPVG
ncbi:short-chain dehydrogenase [Frankia sp. CcI49]|uniref:SDR family oxidoreductase n=1 Tax=unclassified Frankia TaxID=2632575 RepID=UPI0006CA0342|nr:MULTISPECIES: SDR family oxidoreductase [unclassified Frankia]KPM53469.1 short-chain dehydrogenase [Frankia sp. R43]ONH54809.1 short-chain dehydrogenase [Frankia sp. CcI49]